MLGRLDQSFEGQRLFVANASHELRTPLTSMRTALDVTLSKTDLTTELVNELGERLRRQITKSDQIIEALLTLSISHRHVTRKTKIDLLAVVANTMDEFEFAIEQRNLRTELDLRPAEIMGDQVLLERLVANLVDNAVRHNVDGGWVRVETGSKHDTTFIIVTNGGTLIAEESLDNLIEPFNRVEARLDPNGGVGLGLTLVSSIATAHDAGLRLERLDAGGLSVRLDFGDSQNQ
jgi:signal transduction histidine kinase